MWSIFAAGNSWAKWPRCLLKWKLHRWFFKNTRILSCLRKITGLSYIILYSLVSLCKISLQYVLLGSGHCNTVVAKYDKGSLSLSEMPQGNGPFSSLSPWWTSTPPNPFILPTFPSTPSALDPAWGAIYIGHAGCQHAHFWDVEGHWNTWRKSAVLRNIHMPQTEQAQNCTCHWPYETATTDEHL